MATEQTRNGRPSKGLSPKRAGASGPIIREKPPGHRLKTLLKAAADVRKRESETTLQHQQLRRLTARLIDEQESGNRIVAQELHDVICQQLAVLALEATAISQRPPRSASAWRESIDHLVNEIGRTAGHVQELSRGLHPLVIEDLGLEAALSAECEAFSTQYRICCRFSVSGMNEPVAPEVALCLYRFAQEALRNAARHSGAERVEMCVDQTRHEIGMTVTDFGHGFRVENRLRGHGLGLLNIEERARMIGGAMSITSVEGSGTTLAIRVPLPKWRTT